MALYHKNEIDRRRTFGIISHPDAGKTTLTEKLLLFGGAIQQAGAVKAKKAQRHATSDWLAIEQERGISVTTSVMRFKYQGYEINLLDTPGHQDFSEDTYRVLTAVDSALMVIDSAKGVEPQTEKLMEVCRMRNTPIITFINKLDREGMAPLDILDDIEDKLQIECTPLSWPIGMGKRFKGVYDLYRKELHLFTPGRTTSRREGIVITDLSASTLDDILGSQADELREDIALIEGAVDPFKVAHYIKGSQTPVFFGSAINNFGVKELLDAFVEMAPSAGPTTHAGLDRAAYYAVRRDGPPTPPAAPSLRPGCIRPARRRFRCRTLCRNRPRRCLGCRRPGHAPAPTPGPLPPEHIRGAGR